MGQTTFIRSKFSYWVIQLVWQMGLSFYRTRPIAISRVLSHLPTVTLAYCDTCLLWHLPSVTVALCDSCPLWHLPSLTLAFCDTCLLSPMPTLTLAYFHTCLLSHLSTLTLANSHLPTLTLAYFHTCLLSHLPTLTLAYSHTCLLSHLPTLTLACSHTCLLSHLPTLTFAYLYAKKKQSLTDRRTDLLTKMVNYRDANVVYNWLNTLICASLPLSSLKMQKSKARQTGGRTYWPTWWLIETRMLFITH